MHTSEKWTISTRIQPEKAETIKTKLPQCKVQFLLFFKKSTLFCLFFRVKSNFASDDNLELKTFHFLCVCQKIKIVGAVDPV